MTTRTMQCKAAVTAGKADGLEEGEFEAIVSAFDNVDSYGDVVVKGAFSETLKEWADSGDLVPVIWAHDWADPFSHLGVVKSAEETDKGLLIRGYIGAEEREANPKAAQVWRLMKERRVKQFSFAFDVLDGAEVEKDGKSFYELRRLKLHEVGPCLLGVNQATELISAKAAIVDQRKAATLDRAKHAVAKAETIDDLRSARELLDSAIADLDAGDEAEDEKTSEGAESSKNAEGAESGAPASETEEAEGAESGAKGASARTREILRELDFMDLEADLIH